MTIQLYAGNQFYPLRGLKDFKGHFDSIQKAQDFVIKLFEEDVCVWAQIVSEQKIILSGQKDCMDNCDWEWTEEKEQ